MGCGIAIATPDGDTDTPWLGVRCEACRGKARAQARAEMVARAPEMLVHAGWGTRYARAELTQFPPEVREPCRALLRGAWDGLVRGALFFGRPGTGKTHLTAAVGRELLIRGRDVRFLRSRKLLREVRETYGDDARASEDQVIARLAAHDLLVIDDLQREGRVNDHVIGVWHEILDERLDNHRPVIVTTNLTTDELAAHYGEGIASRILSLETKLVLGGPDRRTLVSVVH